MPFQGATLMIPGRKCNRVCHRSRSSKKVEVTRGCAQSMCEEQDGDKQAKFSQFAVRQEGRGG